MSDRIRTARAGDIIGGAIDLVPRRLREIVGPIGHFEGDPHLAGLLPDFTRDAYLREYGDPDDHEPRARAFHRNLRVGRPASERELPLTAYLSSGYLRHAVVLHEFGHAVHHAVEWGDLPTFARAPWTRLGADDYFERFAEAFVAWTLPPEMFHPRRDRRYVGAAAKFYATDRFGDNRQMLGLLNTLAGWRFDTPPRSLR